MSLQSKLYIYTVLSKDDDIASLCATDPGVKTHLSRLRVARTYSPGQNGAKRFALRYGDQLVCVRHRLNETGTIRHTTIELLAESTPIAARTRSLIALRIPSTDRETRATLMACGAIWQPKQSYWLLPHLVAKNLRLLRHRVPVVR